jgi:two-component system CheB/CheR fusion protein
MRFGNRPALLRLSFGTGSFGGCRSNPSVRDSANQGSSTYPCCPRPLIAPPRRSGAWGRRLLAKPEALLTELSFTPGKPWGQVMVEEEKPVEQSAISSLPSEPTSAPESPVETALTATAEASEPTQSEQSFAIVGIGASAGGLAAVEPFFSAMPADREIGMAFVLVQHLSPDHKSILCDLVKRYTRMQVYEVEDGMKIQPNCAYIIPPNRDMAILNGSLQLLESSAPRGLRLPIDFFFRSLAQDQRERAICIVLSGTGSDGTLGVRAVKGEGGMAMAQSPDTTEYDGMPRSAIATGLVDYILPPAEMPTQLVAYVAHAFGKKPGAVSAPAPKSEDTLKKLCVVLRDKTGHDFSQYKENNLLRRVERRMALHQIERLSQYLRYAQQNPMEVEALFRDLLIGVTRFFRDPEAFTVLQTQVIPRLFAGKPPGGSVRVWVCGCSTGEEAYSIAILLQEHLNTLKQTYKAQIFATDIDRQAIEQARSGVFPASIAADVSPERLAHFFALDADGSVYRVRKAIRDLMVFSEQDVIKDPPFSKLDLISCRNLLIYLNGNLQKKLIPLFHYALNPEGMLFLGTSETVGEFTTLFTPLDRRWKLYLRQANVAGAVHPALGDFIPPLQEAFHPRPIRAEDRSEARLSLRELTEQALLTHYAPAAILVNGRGEILHIFGRTGRYLEPAPGDAGLNILDMARQGLRRELTITLHKAVVHRETVRCPGLRVKSNGDFTTANLTVRPVVAGADGGAPPDLFLVLLEEMPAAEPARSEEAGAEAAFSADLDGRIALLEQELRAKEEYLQTTLEEMETSNEELKSTNEEMQSVNEELQSTNEELETSKEELQSVNEELATVNAELQTKVADLSRANNDMNNLLAGTGVGTLFVDLELRIARFTPAATQVINLIEADIGRPLGHVVSNLVGYERLLEDVQTVLDNLIPQETEVQTKAGAWYLMRIRPYRTLENAIEGVVLTFVDISQRKQTQEALKESEARLAGIIDSAMDAIITVDEEQRIVLFNPAAERMFRSAASKMLGEHLDRLIPKRFRALHREHVRRFGQTCVTARRMGALGELSGLRADGEEFPIEASISRAKAGGQPLATVIVRDISERKWAEQTPGQRDSGEIPPERGGAA